MNPIETRSFTWLSRVVLALLLILCGAVFCPAQVFLDTPPLYPTGGAAVAIATGDLNGDGKLDLVTANYTGSISVLLGNGDGTFSKHIDSPTPKFDSALAIADFNGDGRLDVVTANSYYIGTISILLGNGDGTFQPHRDYSVNGGPTSVAAADLNQDGKVDLVIANGFVGILVGNGDGTFQGPQLISTVFYPAAVTVADLNRDGRLDLAVANNLSNFGIGSVSVLLGNGDGTFQPHQEYQTTNSPNSITAADLNGDGIPDLVTANGANYSSDTVGVLLGNGDGTFYGYRDYVVRAPLSATVVDLNLDGKMDIVATDSGSTSASVLLGNGDGTFQNFISYACGTFPSGVIAADLNSDGIPDLAVASDTVGVLLGNGDGTFTVRADYPTGDTPSAIAVADFNRDGRPDVVTANYFGSSATVLLQDGHDSFRDRTDYSVAFGASSITTADFDGDGNSDFVVNDALNVAVFLGKGDGTFQPKIDSPGRIGAFVAADFNRDGKLDLVGIGSDGIAIMLGNGDGTFGAVTSFPGGKYPAAIVVADFNGDGKLDVAFADWRSARGAVGILLGKGDGTFQPALKFKVQRHAFFLAAGDLNGDGKIDLVVAHAASLINGIGVLLGNDDGTFQAEKLYDADFIVQSLALGDLNGDGKLDLVATGGGYQNIVSVRFGKGDGTFLAPIRHQSALDPFRPVLADFNGDGALDLAVTNGSPESTVSIYLNLRGSK